MVIPHGLNMSSSYAVIYFRLGSKYASVIGRKLLHIFEAMNPLYVCVTLCMFQKFHKIYGKTPVQESLHINLILKACMDLINAEAATGSVL